MLACPELQIPNTLPRASRQLPILNRHRHARANKRRLDVSLYRSAQVSFSTQAVHRHPADIMQYATSAHRHIIQPLRRMPIQRPLLVLGRQPVQRIAHVLPDLLVPVLVQAERTARVLHEEVEQADFVLFELGELLLDVRGDEVGAAGLGGQRELLLEPGHCGLLLVLRTDGDGGGDGKGGGGGGEDFEGQMEYVVEKAWEE